MLPFVPFQLSLFEVGIITSIIVKPLFNSNVQCKFRVEQLLDQGESCR